MIHKLYVGYDSEAEERLLYVFRKANAEYYRELVRTEEGEIVMIYEFDDVAYKAVKQYLENEES